MYEENAEGPAVRRSYKIRNTVAGWFFRLDELSTGYWKIKGRNGHGNTVSLVGRNRDMVLLIAEEAAREMSDGIRVPA
jgi:hypothetical protein